MATIIKDTKKYKALLATTTKAAGTLRDQLDTALRSAVYHVYKHGDVTGLNKLLDATDNVVASNAHRKWLVDFAKPVMRWDTKTKGFAARDKEVRDLVVEDDLVKALEDAPTYYDHTKPPPFTGWSVAAQVNAIIKRAESLAAKHDSGELTDEEWAKVDLSGLVSVKNLAKFLAKAPKPAAGSIEEAIEA